MKTFKMSPLGMSSVHHYINFIESAGDFMAILKDSIATRSDFKRKFIIPDDRDDAATFYICASTCTMDIMPFRITFVDKVSYTKIVVVVDRRGRVKGWF